METNSKKDIGQLLKKFGYSMPQSEEEIIAFENKFTADFESPKEWPSIENIIDKDISITKKVIKLNENKAIIPLSMAAREGKKITDEIREKMRKDKNEAKK
ncbi:hypothetical protein LPB03_11990 [Polaribacter vadi]|uniref:Uncharacterized protein n=1 Tax=Polaribacter vadi TaxID=1774273 RepID=A0A1B8TT79_9FLAO|nr:hypothetical protein [Polaribacter vadi]AOW18129.1 hypothetical protein LPB03_11990 [Polaribacter vadi]OBY62857.1 hypothetical protein LPB3_12000 [Polaribacter vadi]